MDDFAEKEDVVDAAAGVADDGVNEDDDGGTYVGREDVAG